MRPVDGVDLVAQDLYGVLDIVVDVDPALQSSVSGAVAIEATGAVALCEWLAQFSDQLGDAVAIPDGVAVNDHLVCADGQ